MSMARPSGFLCTMRSSPCFPGGLVDGCLETLTWIDEERTGPLVRQGVEWTAWFLDMNPLADEGVDVHGQTVRVLVHDEIQSASAKVLAVS